MVLPYEKLHGFPILDEEVVFKWVWWLSGVVCGTEPEAHLVSVLIATIHFKNFVSHRSCHFDILRQRAKRIKQKILRK